MFTEEIKDCTSTLANNISNDLCILAEKVLKDTGVDINAYTEFEDILNNASVVNHLNKAGA